MRRICLILIGLCGNKLLSGRVCGGWGGGVGKGKCQACVEVKGMIIQLTEEDEINVPMALSVFRDGTVGW